MAQPVIMQHIVAEADTAAAVGSGDVPVLATPHLIAWLEAATVRAAAGLLLPDQTSVGTAIRVEHLRATPLGGRVRVEVEVPEPPETRHLTFVVGAIDDDGQLVAAGEIDRAIVDRARFLASIGAAERQPQHDRHSQNGSSVSEV